MMKDNSLTELILSDQLYKEDDILFEKNFNLEKFELKSTNLKRLDFSYNPSMMTGILESLSSSYNKLEYISLKGCLI